MLDLDSVFKEISFRHKGSGLLGLNKVGIMCLQIHLLQVLFAAVGDDCFAVYFCLLVIPVAFCSLLTPCLTQKHPEAFHTLIGVIF